MEVNPMLMNGTNHRNPSCVGYVRVSSETQVKQGLSLPEQRERITKEAERRGWRLLELIEDPAETGKTFDRPGIAKLIEYVIKGDVQYVLVAMLDRFGRNVAEGASLYNSILKPKGVHVIGLDGTTTETDQGVMVFHIGLAIAENELSRLKARTRMGRLAAAKAGRWPGGKQPYGYDWSKATNKYIIIEKEAAIVRQVFELYLGGKSTHAISERLFAQGIKTRPTKKDPSGTNPGPTWISRVLTCEAYTGTMPYRVGEESFKLSFPPIITSDELAAAKGKLAQAVRKSTRGLKREILTSGWVFCGECERLGRPGLRMYTAKTRFCCGTQIPSLRNRKDQHKYRHESCGNPTVPTQELDDLLWAYMRRLLFDNRWRIDILTDSYEDARAHLDGAKEDMEKLKDRLDTNQAEQIRQARLFMIGAVSEEVVKAEGERLQRERAAVESELSRIQKLYAEAAAAAQAIRGGINLKPRKWAEMPFTSRRALLDLLFPEKEDGVYVYASGRRQVRAKWAAPEIQNFLMSIRAFGDEEFIESNSFVRSGNSFSNGSIEITPQFSYET